MSLSGMSSERAALCVLNAGVQAASHASLVKASMQPRVIEPVSAMPRATDTHRRRQSGIVCRVRQMVVVIAASCS